MLAAHAHGVGSSIGCDRRPQQGRGQGLLGIPKGEGCADPRSPSAIPTREVRRSRAGRGQARKPLDEIVREESYA